MIERLARCNCGQLRVTCAGEPARISVCHCLDCKRRTGSAFSYNATYAGERVTPAGRFHSFARQADSGRTNTYRFCPRCGTTVFYEVEARPGMISVPAGAFADPDFPAPTVEVYEERRAGWCVLELAVPAPA